jgi:hypothetical protein
MKHAARKFPPPRRLMDRLRAAFVLVDKIEFMV